MTPWTISPWLSEVEEPAPALDCVIRADAVILGAGFTGLSAALELRASGMDVVLLEREVAAFGASGRDAGHLTPTIGKDLPTLRLLYGRERASELVHFAEEAVRHAEGMIAKHAVDCAYEPVGNVLAAVHSRQHAMVDRAAAAANELGADTELLDDAALAKRGFPRAFTRGLLERRGGILNPGLYARALRRAALAAGVRLHEHSAVLALHPERRVRATTAQGEVSADIAVIATNAYSSELALPIPDIARLAVQLFATRPLTEDERERIGWPGREGIYTAHEILEGYRLTADDRIVGGSKHVRYGYDNQPLPDVDPTIATSLERVFHQRFPELDDVTIEHHWGGPIAIALDFLPRIGRAGPHDNILYAIAYAGHGVAQASYAGKLLGDLLHGRPSLAQPLITRTAVPLPPEPLRWLVARALTGVFSWIDARTDAAIG